MLFLNLDSAKLGRTYDEWRPSKCEAVTVLLDELTKEEAANTDGSGMIVQNITAIFVEIADKYYLLADGKEMLDLILADKSISLYFLLMEKTNALVAIPAISLLMSLVNYYAFSSLNAEDKTSPELNQKNRERLESQPLVVQLCNKFEGLSKKFPSL